MHSSLTLLISTAALCLGACRKVEVVSYRVPKAEDSEMLLPIPATALTSREALIWIAPMGWVKKPASGMRRSSFTVLHDDGSSADLSIITLPGTAGGLASNLNRWREQVNLSPLPAAEIEATVTHIDTPAFHLHMVDYVGSPSGVSTRILGAIINHDGIIWFFKLMGPDALVSARRDEFVAFLQTVAPATP